MMNDDTQPLVPDPQIGAALRALSGEPPVEAVDWEALRHSIGDAAALPLARLRTADRAPAPAVARPMVAKRRPMPRWARTLVPLAAAAGIAGVAWVAVPHPGGSGQPESYVASATSTIEAPLNTEEILKADVSDQEFHLLVTGRTNPDELLLLALDQN